MEEQNQSTSEVQNIDKTGFEGADSSEELVVAVRRQIEYYFSKENLQQDAYLTSHMDANMSVPISFVMKFSKLKALTQDESIVIKALEGSIVNFVDGKIKANVKSGGRSTIILREIPSDTPEQEVREIFNFEGCKPISSMRSDIGDTWFVMMESEDDAKDTLIDLRLKKRLFRGQTIKGRVKSETIVRSFYPMQPVPPPIVYPGMQQYPPYPIDMRTYGYPVPPILNSNSNNSTASSSSNENGTGNTSPLRSPIDANGQVSNTESSATETEVPSSTIDSQSDQNQLNSQGDASYNKINNSKVERKNNSIAQGNNMKTTPKEKTERKVANNNISNNNLINKEKETTKQPIDKKTHPRTNKRDPSYKSSASPSTSVEISSANFPPLHSQDTEESPVPTPGYKGDFIKYSCDDIVNIVKNITKTSLPETIKPEDHPLAMTVLPNMDLLKRQRTFSIDETREQLRQGRPVQREAIVAGAVDYGSMMYGDGYQQTQSVPTISTTSSSTVEVTPPVSNEQFNTVITLPEVIDESPTPSSTTQSNSSSEVPAKKAVASSWAALVMSSTPPVANTPSADGVSPVKAKIDKASVTKENVVTKKGNGSAPLTAAAKNDTGTVTKKFPNDKKKVDQAIRPKKENKFIKKENKEETTVVEKTEIDAPATESATIAAVASENAAATNVPIPVESETAKENVASASTSSWGGKPTFANILKLQAETSPPQQQSKETVKPAVKKNNTTPIEKTVQNNNKQNGKPVTFRKEYKDKGNNKKTDPLNNKDKPVADVVTNVADQPEAESGSGVSVSEI